MKKKNGLAPNRRQGIIWANADSIHWHVYATLGGDELMVRTTENRLLWALFAAGFIQMCSYNCWLPPNISATIYNIRSIFFKNHIMFENGINWKARSNFLMTIQQMKGYIYHSLLLSWWNYATSWQNAWSAFVEDACDEWAVSEEYPHWQKWGQWADHHHLLPWNEFPPVLRHNIKQH